MEEEGKGSKWRKRGMSKQSKWREGSEWRKKGKGEVEKERERERE